jgi:hypothetical protein
MDMTGKKVNEQNVNTDTACKAEEYEIKRVEELRNLLTAHSINSDRSILGSEPFFEPVMQGKNRDVVMGKIIQLINKW